MSQKGHKRPRLTAKVLGLVSALVLGGGGVAVVAGNASAGQDRAGRLTSTIDCPDVGEQLKDVPDQAKAEVDTGLAKLDDQVADATGGSPPGRPRATSCSASSSSSATGPSRACRTRSAGADSARRNWAS